MREKDLDPKIDYSYFSTEHMLEPIREAIMRGHRYYVITSMEKQLNKEGLYADSS